LLRPVIRKHGLPSFRPHGEYFDTLVDSIISQQISSRAAESIRRKVRDLFGGMLDPRVMADAPDELLRGAGISPQKLRYLRSLCGHLLDGRLELERFPEMADEGVIGELTAVDGIGVWTAQMFLIFSLGRLDVLPVGDLGVQRGAQIVYDLEELPRPRQVAELAESRKWAPFRSIASWYLWRATP
jgi:DNA-3-methyladenine glycosylase II